ncbi:histone-lysine N-methyltransferase SMYD3-like [Toxorhynchites rutilus septentrionalis]|uniref:histone-lysine N-methyltransferase SMYD3-like n=1 Tax=Toxorhynchites rutilus septentrionalis TaxID=329112 RepID=UPI00247A3315|nr:histone-lysine N-methyltransferase SMYD3-like [Toxorhynchites rutilus septentrionalis]
MIRPEVVQQLTCPAFGLATSWIISRKGVPVESLQEIESQFRRELWPFPARVSKKDNYLAKSLREKANECYKSEPSESDKVLRLYNESISCATPGSDEISMGYANRSAIYFNQKNYRRCVRNIELAKRNNYPQSKMAKLIERENKCKEFLQEFVDNNEVKEKIGDADLSKLQLIDNPQYGRGIATKTDLNVGNIFFSELPCLIVLEPDAMFSRCNYCGRENEKDLIPCDSCCSSMYCSEECKEKALMSYHRFECKIAEKLKHLFKGPKSTRMFHLALRLFWMILSNFSTNPVSFRQHLNEKFKNFRNPFLLESEKIPFHILSVDQPDMSKDRTGEGIMQFISVLMYKIVIEENDSTRNSLLEEDHSCLLEILHGLVLRAKNISDQSGDDMTCLYPLLRMVNHSCAPNAERFMINGTSILVAKRPIKVGEQILISYIPNCTVETKEKDKRKAMLQKEFNFDCQCSGCSLDYPILSAVEEDRKLKDELNSIMSRDEDRLNSLEDFIQRHDGRYPNKELAGAWKAYRNEKIKDMSS